jgi:hypothetical protein
MPAEGNPMKRISIVFAVLLSACASAPDQPPGAEANTNQILAGRWMSTKRDSKCVRYVDFRPDGTMSLVDGDARIDARYRLSGRATPKGLYKLDATVIKENVGKDCDGNASADPIPPGLEFELGYIWMDGSKSVFMMCEQDSYAYCEEPMQRVR